MDEILYGLLSKGLVWQILRVSLEIGDEFGIRFLPVSKMS